MWHSDQPAAAAETGYVLPCDPPPHDQNCGYYYCLRTLQHDRLTEHGGGSTADQPKTTPTVTNESRQDG